MQICNEAQVHKERDQTDTAYRKVQRGNSGPRAYEFHIFTMSKGQKVTGIRQTKKTETCRMPFLAEAHGRTNTQGSNG